MTYTITTSKRIVLKGFEPIVQTDKKSVYKISPLYWSKFEYELLMNDNVIDYKIS